VITEAASTEVRCPHTHANLRQEEANLQAAKKGSGGSKRGEAARGDRGEDAATHDTNDASDGWNRRSRRRVAR